MNCPLCKGEGVELGSLGTRHHFRCRNCGMEYSTALDAYALALRDAEDESMETLEAGEQIFNKFLKQARAEKK